MQKKTVWITSAAATAVLAVGGASVAVATGETSDDGGEKALTGQSLERATQAALAEVGQGTVTDAETSDDGGSAYELEVALDKGGEIDVELNDSYEVVHVGEPETEDDEASSERPLNDSAEAKAKEAALNETGGGNVEGIERSDDGDAAYEVEVTLDNGKEAEVHLDEGFQPVKGEDGDDD